ncbi:MAG TPA: hypothetical protein PKL73_00620 [Polyangiaceae bacterium]|nr:MAG: hypothetical protein BWY17_04266 [Deltaproteobacteria bacterium ADurb.Bin207]HNS95420.1 hypothetical protein [Polyangiaceae bacterium]HNZ20640.1 hypothetical protein [Polyangiaceae bacterium]HOD20744.1 hypothetical protein [Polyangiaceae bacterium]HOE47164.1 hypothetical protein [Polyangiaceae bacterium]
MDQFLLCLITMASLRRWCVTVLLCSSAWVAACTINPQPEPPGSQDTADRNEAGTGGQFGGVADAGISDCKTPGDAGCDGSDPHEGIDCCDASDPNCSCGAGTDADTDADADADADADTDADADADTDADADADSDVTEDGDADPSTDSHHDDDAVDATQS